MGWVTSFSPVWLFVTPGTVSFQAPLSTDFPDKSTGVGCHFLLQGIFPTQGSNPDLPHCRQMLYHLSHQGSPARKYPNIQHKNTWSEILACIGIREFQGPFNSLRTKHQLTSISTEITNNWILYSYVWFIYQI